MWAYCAADKQPETTNVASSRLILLLPPDELHHARSQCPHLLRATASTDSQHCVLGRILLSFKNKHFRANQQQGHARHHSQHDLAHTLWLVLHELPWYANSSSLWVVRCYLRNYLDIAHNRTSYEAVLDRHLQNRACSSISPCSTNYTLLSTIELLHVCMIT